MSVPPVRLTRAINPDNRKDIGALRTDPLHRGTLMTNTPAPLSGVTLPRSTFTSPQLPHKQAANHNPLLSAPSFRSRYPYYTYIKHSARKPVEPECSSYCNA